MRLKQLAGQTDRAEFQRLYHDPTVHTSTIADLFGVQQSRLSEFAHLLGIPTRRQAGVMWTPTLLRVKDSKSKKPGQHGCNPDCPEWRRCKAGRLWVEGPLPCETLLPFETKFEYEADSSPSYWVIPLEVRVNIEAMA